MKMKQSPRFALATAAAAAALGLVLTGCTNPAGSAEAAGGESSSVDAAQSVKTQSEETCSLEEYGGEKMDLSEAVVGFSQSEKEDNPFRIAETKSITDEAANVGVAGFIKTNAQSKLSKQIADIKSLIAQDVDALIVAPLNSEGLEPALEEAKAKDIPVITIDRQLKAEACADYVTFLGSDFVKQGQRAADQLIEGTGGEAKVAILLGASGNNVTVGRTKGFVEQIEKEAPGIEIVAQQTANFTRTEGQNVTEQLLQSHPGITAIYAENDEMGLGAQAAIIAAGKEPGTDIQIYSIDGTKNAVSQIVAGKYNGVVESNPRFGPLAFETLEKFLSGEPVSTNIVIDDAEYDASNAEEMLDSAF